jgi:hypothetical protein
MLEEQRAEGNSSCGAHVAPPAHAAPRPPGGLRGWLLAHYRFLYAVDLILFYLSSMFYITARIVTGKSSVPSRTLLVIVIGSGIMAALPLVTGANFEKDFVGALRSPGSKKLRRIEIAIVAALVLILAVVLAVAISHPAHRLSR